MPSGAYYAEAVNTLYARGIVSGVGDNSFNPGGNATIEQALSISLRMYNSLK